ncbi:hypothetical protein GCM10010885_20710 [Alicyclobacillus cellulosilyticus]|uniref:Acylneuraminate cytidylyltransferase n=1 Tax=Alicyclobacillus cellulosilyticus TaxID=1003997 RepID=A0A917KF87_9BACL|nr:hypothetical protein GCM10010885_20710 [Alicyclobacillus cellulosilyticus]
MVLQPTSPLRTAEDIDGCVRLCIERGGPACVSVTAVKQHPAWMFTLREGRLQPLLADGDTATRRQDLPPLWTLNGAVYVADVKWLLMSRTFLTRDTIAYPMPEERSVDIDDELDWFLAEALLQQK